jgi:predicted Zn finger-like uncharacterized protein
MFTVCPKCTLTLAVTAADLRTGQGYVRCGRCLNVFNALLALSEEPTASAAPPVYSQADPASESQINAALAIEGAASIDDEAAPDAPDGPDGPNAPDRAAEADVAQSLNSATERLEEGSTRHAPEPAHPQLETESSSDGSIENESSLADGTGTFETIVLEGDAITQTEEFVPGESVDSEIAALTRRLRDVTERHPQPTSDVDAAAESVEAEAEASIAADAAPAAPRWRWLFGASLLILVLAAQAVHHWRDSLASSAALNAPMTRLYARLGLPLDPHWNLAAYDVRQQGAVSDAADPHLIHVRLSVGNRANRAQPVPLLRLTLLDRYGKRIASRDLTPGEYWPHGQPQRAFLGRDERIDTEVAVHDPDADSSSFELDVCLRSSHGMLHCAGDAPVTSPAPVP